jgi:hypothetical protein
VEFSPLEILLEVFLFPTTSQTEQPVDKIISLEWIQAGFAGFALILLWILHTTLRQLLAEMTMQTVMIRSLVDQQDGGMKFVVEQLIADLKEAGHAR